MRSVVGMAVMAALSFLADAMMAQEAGNLVKNPDFSVKNSKGILENWRTPGKQWSIDEKNIPPGCKASFSVTIAEANESAYGYVQQKLNGLKKGTAYMLHAKVKAGMPKMGFIEVKMYDDGGKELTRIDSQRNSGTDWEALSLEFNTAEAASIGVLCRYGQSKQFVGSSVLFSDVRLVEKK